MKTERKKLFIHISINHSGDYWIEEIKNKKKKISDTARDVTEDNPLTPFDKGDLRKKQHCDMVIDTTIVFLPSAVFPLRAFRINAEETK